MSDMKYESEPVEVWEYRETRCVLYCLRTPDDSRWIGYAQFADEMIEVLDQNGTDSSGDPDRMKQRVKSEVDSIVQDILNDTLDEFQFPLDDPNPGIDPDPIPNPLDPNPDPPGDDPFPPGPQWRSICMQMENGSTVEVSLSDLDADDVTADGLYDG